MGVVTSLMTFGSRKICHQLLHRCLQATTVGCEAEYFWGNRVQAVVMVVVLLLLDEKKFDNWISKPQKVLFLRRWVVVGFFLLCCVLCRLTSTNKLPKNSWNINENISDQLRVKISLDFVKTKKASIAFSPPDTSSLVKDKVRFHKTKSFARH